MDTKIYRRIERIGSILSLPEDSQLSKLQGYLKEFHLASYELMQMDRSGRGKLAEAPKASNSLIKAYKDWLSRHDAQWQKVELVVSVRRGRNQTWEETAEATGLSPETCRQIVQALIKGGLISA